MLSSIDSLLRHINFNIYLRSVVMKKNMGTGDRLLRILAAIVIAYLYFTDIISGTLAIILGIVAILFLITSLMKFCPAYTPLGISTEKKEEK